MQRERGRDSVTRRVRELPKPGHAEKRRRYFDDVAVVVWVVALIGIVVLCGAVMVLSVISATVTMSTRIAGPESDSRTMTGSESGAALVDDDWAYGPKLTR